MILNTTTKSIEVLLGEAITTSNCDVTASYGDYAGSLFLPGASDTVTNGVTAVTVVAAPTASVQRLCNELTVHNNDTVTHRVIVRLNNSGTFRIFRQSDVPPGGDLIYAPGDGGVTEVEPAILLESGTIGAKISALPAFNLALPPVGTEKLPIVEAGATDAMTLAQAYQLFTNWLHYVATNPLDAATITSAGQDVQVVAGAGGATSGRGGDIAITGGAATDGRGGNLSIYAGLPSGGNNVGGGIDMEAQTGAGSGAGGTVYIQSGYGGATGSGGPAFLQGGDGGASGGDGGSANLQAGAGASATGNGGDVIIRSGDSFFFGNGAGGKATHFPGGGNGTGAGGDLHLKGGGSNGSGKTGDIILELVVSNGSGATGNVLLVNLPTVDPGISGAAWVDPVTHLLHLSP